MFKNLILLYYIVIGVLLLEALGQTIVPSGKVTVKEENTVSFNCTNVGSVQEDIIPQRNNVTVDDPGLIRANAITNGAAYNFGPVTQNHNNSRLRCYFVLLDSYTAEIILNVEGKFQKLHILYLVMLI